MHSSVWPKRAMRRVLALTLSAALLGGSVADSVRASEGGASFYLLGSGGPAAAVMPPFKGIYLDNTTYLYGGQTQRGKEFSIGGNVVVGIDTLLLGNFTTLLWVPTTNLVGGTLALGLAVPIGGPWLDVSAVLTGPRGNQAAVGAEDSAFTIGDPALTGMLGWKFDDFHLQASTLINVPIGDYHEGALANIAFHRWAADLSVAASWHSPMKKWDVSAKAGFTFNGTNDATDYTTGTEFHLEGAVERIVSPLVSLGLQAYYFDQVTGDSGSGAALGPFEGKVAAVGVTVASNFMAGKIPMALRLRVFQEFEAENRAEGTVGMLSLSFPLHVDLPPGATGG
jgi:hypothetical protein